MRLPRSKRRSRHPLWSLLGHYRSSLEHPTGARLRAGGDEALDWIGHRVDDVCGGRVGSLVGVLVDRESGRPLWLMLEIRGRAFTAVPRAGAVAGNGHVCVPYPRSVIAAAPRFAPHGALTAPFDAALRAAFDLPRPGWADMCWDRRAVTAPAVVDPENHNAVVWAPGPRSVRAVPAADSPTVRAPRPRAAETAGEAPPRHEPELAHPPPYDAAHVRDLAAAARDRVADLRDRAAVAREKAALELPPGGGGIHLGDGPRRRGATEPRRASDRLLVAGAARDRALAAKDRVLAARDRAQAAEERGQAATDVLTGARRREVGLLELQREIDRAVRTGTPLVAAFIDVDGLKAVNDHSGHLAGDALLARVASALRVQLRSYDLILRFGGDEFICGLPGVSLADVHKRFKAIAHELAAAPGGGSISVGFAELRAGDTPASLISRADGELLAGRRRNSQTASRGSYR